MRMFVIYSVDPQSQRGAALGGQPDIRAQTGPSASRLSAGKRLRRVRAKTVGNPLECFYPTQQLTTGSRQCPFFDV
jgi:hypothetical protein